MGALTPASMRVFPFLSVVAGLVFVFLALRRRFDAWSSVAGVLAVAVHSLVVKYAFEARFYGPLFGFAAMFAWAIGIDGNAPSRRRDIIAAIAAVLLCTVHWFGVLSLGLMCAGVLVHERHSPRAGLRRIFPAAAGVVALLACAPLLLGQRASLREPTWVPPLNSAQIAEMTRTFWFAVVPVVAAFCILARQLLRRPAAVVIPGESSRPERSEGAASHKEGSAVSLFALGSLSLLPLVLIALSLFQPAMLPRYGLTAVLAWAPLVAFAVAPLRPVFRGAVGAILAYFVFGVTSREGELQANFGDFVAADRAAYAQACSARMPIVFETRHVMYPATDGKTTCPGTAYLAISDSTLARMFPTGSELEWMQRFFRVENHFARLHERLYSYPRVTTQEQVAASPEFMLVATDLSLPRGYKDVAEFARVVFPGHTPRRLSENLTVLQRR